MNIFQTVGYVTSNSVAHSGTGNFSDYLRGNLPNSFIYDPVDYLEIDSIIRTLKDKRCNIHVIPNFVLKNISSIISPILAKITNISVLSGIFPKSLKVARVVPIHKTGSKKELNNYRPISILSAYSKIIEKVMYRRVYKFLEKYSILSSHQYGFRSGKSTTQAILEFLNFVYPTLDSGFNVVSVFCDFSKAFDSVDHSVLIYKLQHYGIRGFCLDWFRSFLTGRSQHVIVSGVTSDNLLLTHGVPQGSVLGPLLFLIFINDMPKSSDRLKFTLFADDSTLSFKFDHRSPTLATDTLNEELTKVYKWLSLNRIKTNIDKTKYIVFSYRRNVNVGRVVVGDGVVSRVTSMKFLGVIIDQSLNFRDHIDNTKMKMSKTLGILNKVKHFLPLSTMHTLYTSLLEPYAKYGVEVWGSAAVCHLNGVFLIQKAAVRAVHGLAYDAHTVDYFKRSEIFNIFQLYRYQILQLMYRAVVVNDGNFNVFSSLVRHSETHLYPTRNSDDFIIPYFKMSNSQRSILYSGPKFWNETPLILKNCNSLSIFRKRIKEYMLL